ncbi:hypothetical protein D0Y65_045920 [Glycine soja]|uniref:Uncharacterized protein n=1 Tax=Glycine soja TaxID=3848 RepID=A0A445G771_GLYSO|nr:hypothetical protein D0Y65_045920 [Glycine soja]
MDTNLLLLLHHPHPSTLSTVPTSFSEQTTPTRSTPSSISSRVVVGASSMRLFDLSSSLEQEAIWDKRGERVEEVWWVTVALVAVVGGDWRRMAVDSGD